MKVQDKLNIDNFIIEYNRLLNDIELLSNYINPDDVAYTLDEIIIGNGSILGLIYFN